MRWVRLELTLRLRELLRLVLSMRCCMRLRLRLRLLLLTRGIFQIRCLRAPTTVSTRQENDTNARGSQAGRVGGRPR